MKLLLILLLIATPALAEIPEHPKTDKAAEEADKAAEEAKERVWKRVKEGMGKHNRRLQQRLQGQWRKHHRVYVAIAVVAGLYTVACTVDDNLQCPWSSGKDE